MSKSWQPYAYHVLESIGKIKRITERGDITDDDILYDAALRNLQTMSEATQQLPVAPAHRSPLPAKNPLD